jgi:predicted ATP-grasp superfamily ATP-dependent carboligase
VHDAQGTAFLVLAGPEPDIQWERFIAAVMLLVERFGVRLTVGFDAIPMGVPHTRPIGITAHGTRPELVAGYEPWVHTVQVPASAGHLLEFRLGEASAHAVGFAVHVPHYLAQTEYPAAAAVLVDAVSKATGLDIPTDTLMSEAENVRAEIDTKVAESAEVAAVVRALEQQYDAIIAARGGPLADAAELPTADELGAELERFLAEQWRRGDQPDV